MKHLAILAAVLLLGACGKSDHGDGDNNGSSKTQVVGTTINNNGPCSYTVVINGLSNSGKGSGGSTVTVGNVVITFSPDCSTATISTTSAEALGSGRLPSQ